jgi:ubiquinone/menaquinone biosynthesis C-methylase UbiE
MESGDNYTGLDELLSIETSLRNYNKDLVSKIRKGKRFVKPKVSFDSCLDFGAGIGTLAEIWRDEFNVQPICVEIDDKCKSILKRKGFQTFSTLEDIKDESQSHIYTSNVLEHIENDHEALSQLYSKLQPGGILSIYVPAIPALFSELDRKVGHFRRYKKSELMEKVERAGFSIELCEWNDCLGVAGSLAMKILGYKSNGLVGGRESLVFYDRVIFPLSKFLDSLVFRKIVGKNLLLHAVK